MGEEVAFNRSLKLQFNLNVSKFWGCVVFFKKDGKSC